MRNSGRAKGTQRLSWFVMSLTGGGPLSGPSDTQMQMSQNRLKQNAAWIFHDACNGTSQLKGLPQITI